MPFSSPPDSALNALPPAELFGEIYRRHGHRCPMSTLGGRIGWAARQRCPDLRSPGLRGIYFHGTCAVDGIAVATGLSLATGTLSVRDAGRHTLVLRDRSQGWELELSLRPEALTVAGRYRRLSADLERRGDSLERAEREALEAEKERVLQEVLEELWSLPDAALLKIGEGA